MLAASGVPSEVGADTGLIVAHDEDAVGRREYEYEYEYEIEPILRSQLKRSTNS